MYLASNSLLEAAVFSHRAAVHAAAYVEGMQGYPDIPSWNPGFAKADEEQVIIAHNWDEIRRLMWDYVGIVRTTRRLERALHRVQLLKNEIHEYYANFRVTRDLLELRNLVDCAELIVRSALQRQESRGLHYSRDYPQTLPVSFPTVMAKSMLKAPDA